MAYNSLKRIFGETKLELKLLFLFGVGLLVIIGTAFSWYGASTAELVKEQNLNTAQLMLQEHMVATHLGADKIQSNRLSIVPVSPEDSEKERRNIQEQKKQFSKHAGEVDWIWSQEHPNTGARTPRATKRKSKSARNSAAPAQPSAPDERKKTEYEKLVDDHEYRYFEPIRARDTCLRICHAPPPGGSSGIDPMNPVSVTRAGGVSTPNTQLKPGDVIAIARVSFPVEETKTKLSTNSAILWAYAIGTVFLGVLASYAIVRYVIVKPLRHLRDVSDAVTRGNIALRAEIHTGDEFEELSTAFNRMLRTLITIQDELRQANVNLDGKVDELAQLNMQLHQVNKVKSEFLATMSHELRTPLNSILGFSDVLAGIQSLDDKQKRYVQHIQKSGKTLLDMIERVLLLAKMESGKMELQLTDFRVQQIIDAQAGWARAEAEKKNIDLETSIEPDLPPMRQDQVRLQQILNNLLSNAIRFTPEGGRVTVAAGRDERDCLVLRVIDTGVGIAEEDQQVIFEKFRQGRVGVPSGDALAREYSGSGLGLSIVKELCKLLGGEVSVASELGQGSTFTVRIPWTLSEPARTDAPVGVDFDQFAQSRFE